MLLSSYSSCITENIKPFLVSLPLLTRFLKFSKGKNANFFIVNDFIISPYYSRKSNYLYSVIVIVRVIILIVLLKYKKIKTVFKQHKLERNLAYKVELQIHKSRGH